METKCLSVTYYQQLEHLADFYKIQYRDLFHTFVETVCLSAH